MGDVVVVFIHVVVEGETVMLSITYRIDCFNF